VSPNIQVGGLIDTREIDGWCWFGDAVSATLSLQACNVEST
jgi:hypothetical protein